MSEVTLLPIFNDDDYNEAIASPYAILERDNLKNRILWIDQEISEVISLSILSVFINGILRTLASLKKKEFLSGL